MTPQSRRVVQLSLKKTIIFVVVILIIAAAFIGTQWYKDQPRYGYGVAEDSVGIMAPGVMEMPAMTPPSAEIYYDRDYNYNQADITDTREFLKISYSGRIQTRNVRDVVKDVKGAVREAEGRVDSENSSEQSGYVSFIVPKSRFEAFREEIESLTYSKLYTESVSSQNLLSEKQGIEQQMQSATSTLAGYEQQKKNLDAQHAQSVAAYNRSIATAESELSQTRTSMGVTSDAWEQVKLRNEEIAVNARLAELRNGLDQENRTYASQNKNLVTQIEYAKNNVKYVEGRDEQFGNNIETVQGHVYVNKISLWSMAAALSPIHPTIIIVVLFLVVWWILVRRGYIPKIEFV